MGSVTKADIDRLVDGTTVAREFVDTVARCADSTALRWMQLDGTLGSVSFAEFGDRAARAATGLRSLGVQPGDRVVLMMRNIPAFHVVDMAAYFLGATPISIYNSSSPDQMLHLFGNAGNRVVITEQAFLERILAVRKQRALRVGIDHDLLRDVGDALVIDGNDRNPV